MARNRFPLLIALFALPVISVGEPLLFYKPPQSGAPQIRIGGGTRSLSIPPIQVLAPQELALSAHAQPVLYWYLGNSQAQSFEFSLSKQGSEQVVFSTRLSPNKSGLQTVALSEHGVELEAQADYLWTIRPVDPSGQPSDENTVSAVIRYQPPAKETNSVYEQAESGYWYDALHGLIDAHSPQTNDLLRQIGAKVPQL